MSSNHPTALNAENQKLPMAASLAIAGIAHSLRELAENVAVIAAMDLSTLDSGELRELLIGLGDDLLALADCLMRI